MKTIFILTIDLICLTLSEVLKKHVQNNLCPNYADQPIYDITKWVNRLHLQVCTIVEIGDLNGALFIEDWSTKTQDVNSTVTNYFLGICDVETLSTWQLCNAELRLQRPYDCIIDVLDYERLSSSPRVHRRFCDMDKIAHTQPRCKCAPTVSGVELYCVTGFPTCFIEPLPSSLCEHYSACGFSNCKSSTVLNRIHIIQCGPNCIGRQPFCEYPMDAKTSVKPVVSSYWSEWQEEDTQGESQPTIVGDGIMPVPSHRFRSVSKCINKHTGEGALDCLGPGTNCCPKEVTDCICHTYIEDGILKVYRNYEKKPPISLSSDDGYLEIYDTRNEAKNRKTGRLNSHFHIKKEGALKTNGRRPQDHTMKNELPFSKVLGFHDWVVANLNQINRNNRKCKTFSPETHIRKNRALLTDDPEYIDDDDEDDEDLGNEDIEIEESESIEPPQSSTEELEDQEIHEQQQNEMQVELKNISHGEYDVIEDKQVTSNASKDKNVEILIIASSYLVYLYFL